MKCLTSAQIQAVADREAPYAEREHAESCEVCAGRVAERTAQMARLRDSAGTDVMPAALRHRVDSALAGGATAAGATRLRGTPPPRRWLRAAWGTAAVAAVTLAAVVFIAPLLNEDRGAVSAAEVLAASATRLSEVTTGIEILDYELVLDGVPKDLMPDHENGTYRVRQVIDHGTPGRFRFASYSPDGQPFSSIAQDPLNGRRVMMFTVEGQPYRFELTIPSDVGPSIAEMERLHMQATIAMMQASGDQHLEVVETADGRQYRIDVPKVQTSVVNPVWDLSEARVLIDANDYRVTELAVKGTFLKQAYSVEYRLLNRHIATSVAVDTFDVPSLPNEILIGGAGSVIPARDAMVLALRELTRLKKGAQ